MVDIDTVPRWVIGAAGLLVAFTLGAVAFGGTTSGTWWMPHMWGGWMGPGVWGPGMLLFGLLWMLLLLLVPLGIVYWLFSVTSGERGGDSAMAVLREQFARGEIDYEEFERRRDRLAK